MFRTIKKSEGEKSRRWITQFISIVIALLAAALVIGLLGFNPVLVYKEMIRGSLGNAYRFKETINKTIPILVMGLGFTISFKMNFTNIGVEGQFYMGAIAATGVVLIAPSIPASLMLPLMGISAFIGGGLWCLVAALLKLKWGANETLVTLMLNYIAIKWVSYLQYGPWKDPNAHGFPKIMNFPSSAQLPSLFGVHIGWIVSLILVGMIYVLLERTKFGYELSVIGENVKTARYAGLNTNGILTVAVMLSGGLSGLAGMIQAAGVERTLNDQISGGMGFTAVIAALMAGLHPILLVIVSFFFAILLQGGSYIQSALQIPSAAAEIVEGIVLLFVLGSEFFKRYRFVFTRMQKKEQVITNE